MTVALQPQKTVGRLSKSHASEKKFTYFFVVYFVVFLDDFAFFFIAMALVTSFQ